MNLGAALAGGGGKRRENDFYPTPPEATVALLLKAGAYIGPVVHEPACGDGALAKVLVTHGFRVVATDLVDRGYGTGGFDLRRSPILAPSVITNPPFNLAFELIEGVLAQRPEFFAVLLKATFWNAHRRADLLEREPPRLVLPLTWRLDFTGGGAPTMDCTWFAWGENIPPGLPIMPLRKPTGVFV